jgi:nicotinate-nucleotide pyrophosphorylase (carboxylating)
MMTLPVSEIDRVVTAALAEDAAAADVTSHAIFPEEATATAVFRVKQDGILSGLVVAAQVFRHLDTAARFTASAADGDAVTAGQVVAEVSGRTRALLGGERVALNLLQRMSGIATLTRRYADAVKDTAARILDTRKTAPGLRLLDKFAVACGGGVNHRMSLADLAMIKDNHIKAAGGIRGAVARVRAASPAVKVEVEASGLSEVREAVEAGADIVMLDNMSVEDMAAAVKLVAGRAKTEASGNVSLTNVRAIAGTGVDFISVGRLTHSAPALDISMKIV